MLEMYKGVANSPETTITNNISESDTLIYVLDETRVPEPPNLMVLGTGVSAETIKVISIDGNALTVERGFQGVPRSWNAGTVIARNFTEYDYNALVENIKTLKTKTDINADDILDLMSYVGDLENLDTTEKANLVLAINETYQELAAHKAEMVSYAEFGTTALQSIPSGATYTDIVLTSTRKGKEYSILENGGIKFLQKGTYQVICNVPINDGKTGERRLNLVLNGITNVAGDYKTPQVFRTILQINKFIDANIGDTLKIQIYQNSGESLDVAQFPELMFVQVKKVG